jgi:hypothetical protein
LCASACSCRPDERRLRQLGDLADGRDPARVQLARGDRPDAPQPVDGERMQERELSTGRDDEQAVGLGDAARDLCEELGPGDADRDREADPLADVAPQPRGDLDRLARDPLHPAHVEERLVDRQPLDERRRVAEYGEHGLARGDVRLEARRHHGRVGAQPPRLAPAHRGAHAARLRLVAGGEHDAAADDHRPRAQLRIIPLLDRGEERIQVGMQDRRFGSHEHMFA